MPPLEPLLVDPFEVRFEHNMLFFVQTFDDGLQFLPERDELLLAEAGFYEVVIFLGIFGILVGCFSRLSDIISYTAI